MYCASAIVSFVSILLEIRNRGGANFVTRAREGGERVSVVVWMGGGVW